MHPTPARAATHPLMGMRFAATMAVTMAATPWPSHASESRMRGRQATWPRRAAAEIGQLDLAVYAAVAQTPTPSLDRALSGLSRAANYSRLSIASAAAAQRGWRAARPAMRRKMGLSSVAVTSRS